MFHTALSAHLSVGIHGIWQNFGNITHFQIASLNTINKSGKCSTLLKCRVWQVFLTSVKPCKIFGLVKKNVYVWFFWLFSDCNFDSLSFQLLGDLDKWGVDMFKIAEYSNNRPLTCVTYKIFQVKISCLYFSSITKTCSINEQCKLWKQNSLIYHVLWTNAK